MRWVVGACFLLVGCHLAELEPPKCVAGTHAENGQCVVDPVEGPLVTITSCALTPPSITVAVNGEFRFKNEDDVDRVISGDDGKVWATAPAHRNSPIFAITKTGKWGYTVSGCTAGGTVVVQ